MKRRLGRRWCSDDAGQTFTEYLMILGVLTAIIIAVTGIVVPGMREVVATLITQMSCGLSSAAVCQ